MVAVERGDRCSAFRLVRLHPSPPGVERTLIEPFDRLTPVDRTERARVISRRRGRRLVQALLGSARSWRTPSRAPAAILDLLPWQLVPVMSFLAGSARRMLIADGVGLGKTIEAGLIIDEILSRRPWARVLVLTPAGLRGQWRAELATRFGREAVIADLGWLEHEAHALPADVNPWATVPLVICSWDFAKRAEVLPGPDRIVWDLAIVDEAHALGIGTERSSLVEAVARRAHGLVLLTATPPDGDPSRWDALMRLGVLPGEPPPLVIRRQRSAVTHSLPPRRWKVVHVRSSREQEHVQGLLDEYRARVERECNGPVAAHVRLAMHVLRKRAASCAWALAQTALRRRELLAQQPQEPVQPPLPLLVDPAADLTDEIPDDWLKAPGLGNRRAEIAWLTRLEDAARTAARTERKLAVLKRLAFRVREPVLVFTEYRDTLLHFAAKLRDVGNVALLHGELGPAERQRVIEGFTHGRVRVLLSTDVASEGLNLHQRCRLVVMLDLPWGRTRLEQRIGRLDRLGQQHRVHAVALVTRSRFESDLLGRLDPVPSGTVYSPQPIGIEEAEAMSRQLQEQRTALRALVRDARGRAGEPGARLMREASDGARHALEIRHVPVYVLRRPRDPQNWSGMVAIVEGRLLAADETLIDVSTLALHVPLPVPHLRSRSATRTFVERRLGHLTPHLFEVARRHFAPRWRTSQDDWERFSGRIARFGDGAGRAASRPAAIQPSLFAGYDRRPGSRPDAAVHLPRIESPGRVPDVARAAGPVRESLSVVLALVRQGPGSVLGHDRPSEASRP